MTGVQTCALPISHYDDTGIENENLTVLSNVLVASDDDNNDTHTMHIVDADNVTTSAVQMNQTIMYEDGIAADDDTNDDTRVVKVESSDVDVSTIRVDKIVLSNNDDATDSESNFDLYGDFSSLAAGESATITFAYQAEDSSITQKKGESEFSEVKTVTITVTGTNDKPEVSPAAFGIDDDILDGAQDNRYYERYDTDSRDNWNQLGFNGDNDGGIALNDEYNNVLRGQLSVEDVDVNDTHIFNILDTQTGDFESTLEQGDNYNIGTQSIRDGIPGPDTPKQVIIESNDIDVSNIDIVNLRLENNDGADRTVDFRLEGDFTALRAGETATVTFTYNAEDDSLRHLPGESEVSESKTVTLTITGTNDQPVVEHVLAGEMMMFDNSNWFAPNNGLTITGIDNDNSIVIPTVYSAGLGISSGNNQIDEGSPGYEKIVFDFDTPLNSIDVTLSAFSNFDDANWIAYKDGSIVGSGDAEGTGSPFESTFTINPGVIFDSIRLFPDNDGGWNDGFYVKSLKANKVFSETHDTVDVVGVDDTHDESINTLIGLLTVSDEDINDTHIFNVVDIVDTNTVEVDYGLGTVDVKLESSDIDTSNITLSEIRLLNNDGLDREVNFELDGDFTNLGKGELATVTFAYNAVDDSTFQTPGETNTSETKLVTINILGTNDQPVIQDVTTVVSEESLSNAISDGDILHPVPLEYEDALFMGKVSQTLQDDDITDKHTYAIDDDSLSLSITTSNQIFLDLFSVGTLEDVEVFIEGILGGAIQVDLLNIDSNPDVMDSFTIETVDIPQWITNMLSNAGILEINMDETTGDYSVYSPLFNLLGAHDSLNVSFDYRVTDDAGVSTYEGTDELSQSEAKTVSLTIEGTNDQPVATDRTYETTEGDLVDAPLGIDNIYNDALPFAYSGILERLHFVDEDLLDNVVLTYHLDETVDITTSVEEKTQAFQDDDIVIVDPAQTTVTVNPDGTFTVSNPTFDHLAVGETATITFKYYINDNSGAVATTGNAHESPISESALVTLTVTGTNDQPIVKNVTVGEGEYIIGEFTGTVLSDSLLTIEGSGEIVELDGNKVSVDYWTVQHNGGEFNVKTLSLFDTYIRVYTKDLGGNLVLVEKDNDSGFDLNAEVSIDNLAVGEYIIAVSGNHLNNNEAETGVNKNAVFGEYSLLIESENGNSFVEGASTDEYYIYESSKSPDETNTITGQLYLHHDDDINDTHTFEISSTNTNTNFGGIPNTIFDVSTAGDPIYVKVISDSEGLNEIDINSVTVDSLGAYEVVGDFSALASGDEATVRFRYVAIDDSGEPSNEPDTSESKYVDIVIQGTNDRPEVKKVQVSVNEEISGNNIVMGLLTAHDDDVDDRDEITFEQVQFDPIFNTSTEAISIIGGNTFKLESTDVDVLDYLSKITKVEVNTDGTYKVEGDFNELALGEQIKLTFLYRADDNQGHDGSDIHEKSLSKTKPVIITITGTNDAPILSDIIEEVTYTENDPAMIIDGLVTLDDIDNDTLMGATISITANYEAGADILDINPSFLASGVTSSFVGGVLTLSGEASLADYEAMLEHVTFVNTSENPSSLPRTVEWVVTDGIDPSVAQGTIINVIPVNDTPVAFTNADSVTEAGDGVPEASNLTGNVITQAYNGNTDYDPDGDSLMVVRLKALNTSIVDTIANSNDYFRVDGEYGVLRVNKDGSYIYNLKDEWASTSSLEENEIVTDEFRYKIEDPSGESDSAKLIITVTGTNDVPTITVSTGAIFTEMDGVDTGANAVQISNNITLVDPEGDNLATATVTIENLKDGDELLYQNFGFITGSYDSNTGVLTLTSQDTGGSSLFAFEYALESIKFNNTSDTPDTETRSISYTVTDTNGGTSDKVYETVEVVPTNDTPDAIDDGGVHTVLQSIDFENSTLPFVTQTTGELTDFAGRFGGTGGTEGLTGTFNYGIANAGKIITIEFDMYEIDSWDGEEFKVFINNQEVSSEELRVDSHYGETDGGTSTSDNEFTGWGSEDIHHYTLSAILDENGMVKLGFGSTLNQGLADESWGIDNVLFTTGLVTNEDTEIKIFADDLLANDIDLDGDSLSIISVQGALNGSVAIVDGNVIFTPDANYNGPASFTYTVSDGNGGFDTATVSLTVKSVNDAPEITAETVSVDEDATVSGTID